VSTLSHLVLDWTNSYGIHPFWPFDDRWKYGDSVFIVEPWFWVVSVPALVAASTNRVARALLSLVVLAGLVLAWRVPSRFERRGDCPHCWRGGVRRTRAACSVPVFAPRRLLRAGSRLRSSWRWAQQTRAALRCGRPATRTPRPTCWTWSSRHSRRMRYAWR
jgi:hypothetical protein